MSKPKVSIKLLTGSTAALAVRALAKYYLGEDFSFDLLAYSENGTRAVQILDKHTGAEYEYALVGVEMVLDGAWVGIYVEELENGDMIDCVNAADDWLTDK